MSLKLMHAVMQNLEQADGSVPLTILERWAHDPGSARFLRASANFAFTFTHKGTPYVLRFNRLDERHVETVEAELKFVCHLASRSVPVAQSVPSRSGQDVERVSTALGDFSAAAFAFVAGTQFDLDEMTAGQLSLWGGTLAGIHNAAETYHAPGRPGWREHLALVEDKLTAGPEAGRELLRRVKHELETLRASDSFGLIHFDFEPDNLVWHGDKVWAVDFDDCACYPFVADIAFALRELFGDRPAGVDFGDERFRTFISGYRAVRDVGDEALSHIPLFLAAHNLLSYAKLRQSLADAPDPNEPDWLISLRRRLKEKVEEYEQSFANGISV